MEMTSRNPENVGLFTRGYLKLKALPDNIWNIVVEFGSKAWKLGKDDPRTVIHSFKFAFALTLVSLFYYFEPLYKGFGDSAIWAVFTVIFVFEFSVGGTLGKGLIRMFATLIACSLGIVAHWIANHSGRTGEPILISIFVFVIVAIVTFLRFMAKMKARYDYGLVVAILTFSLISISGYRDDEVLEMARERVTTIIIGSVTSVLVCILIFPVWIGQDLHNLIASNVEKLGKYLEGFGAEYFKTSEDGQANISDKSFLQGFKSVLNSKNSEEIMATLARWEPCHGQFKFPHPWKHYLIVGTIARQCAYKIEALDSYLTSKTQTPMEIRNKLRDTCTKISIETSKALMDSASSIKTMSRSSSAKVHIANSKVAVENLKLLLNTSLLEDACLVDIIPAATVASLLIDIVTCTEKIAESVEELATLASFKSCDPNTTRPPQQAHVLHQGTIQPISDASHHVINIEDEPSPRFPQTENSSA